MVKLSTPIALLAVAVAGAFAQGEPSPSPSPSQGGGQQGGQQGGQGGQGGQGSSSPVCSALFDPKAKQVNCHYSSTTVPPCNRTCGSIS